MLAVIIQNIIFNFKLPRCTFEYKIPLSTCIYNWSIHNSMQAAVPILAAIDSVYLHGNCHYIKVIL